MSAKEAVLMIGFLVFGLVSWMCGVIATTWKGNGRKLAALLVFCAMVYTFTQLFVNPGGPQ